MTRIGRLASLVLLITTFAGDAPAQADLRTQLQAGLTENALANLLADCTSLEQIRLDSNDELEDKRDQSLAAVQCYRERLGLLTAAATDAGTRLAVREALAPQLQAAEEQLEKDNAGLEFMGLNWGLGFGYSISEDDAVDEAIIAEGLVRIQSDRREQPRALLEFHKYFWCDKNNDGTRGCGPFVAVAATEDDILSGVGMGFMFGRRSKPTDSEGFSIGIGVLLDAKVKDLADGFEANQAPPEGATTVRFVEKSRWSGLLFVTRTF